MGRNRVALGEVWLTITQGSAFLATLGFGTQPDRTDSIPNVFFIPFAFVCKQSQRDCVLQPKVARNEKMPNAECRKKTEARISQTKPRSVRSAFGFPACLGVMFGASNSMLRFN